MSHERGSMRPYEWPEAYTLATFLVLGCHHCFVEDCCGPVSSEEYEQIEELAANLAGLDSYPARRVAAV